MFTWFSKVFKVTYFRKKLDIKGHIATACCNNTHEMKKDIAEIKKEVLWDTNYVAHTMAEGHIW